METTRFHRSWRRCAALASMFVTPLAIASCIDAVIGDIEICRYDGEGYALNERFPATDGCNSCTCEATGSVSCTEIACNLDGGGAPGGGGDAGNGTCSHRGNVYKIGETFKDDCNTCSCTSEGVACTLIGCNVGCRDSSGKVYSAGESFPASDGCNTCTCGSDGSIACTEKACSTPCSGAASDPVAGSPLPPECGVCSYGGQTYREGDSFRATDGCNTCRCGSNGVVGCTKIGCPGGGTCEYGGKIYQVGDTFRDELYCNGCSCTANGVTCDARYCDPALACSLGDRRFASGVSVPCSDGCNSCLCNAGSWSSTDAACGPLPKVERCTGVEAGAPKARVLYLDGDVVALEVGMGGCANTVPAFKLCFDGSFAESFPVQTRLRIVPDEVSACSAWTTQEKVFDLTPLRDAYRAAYQTSSGAINAAVPGDTIHYVF